MQFMTIRTLSRAFSLFRDASVSCQVLSRASKAYSTTSQDLGLYNSLSTASKDQIINFISAKLTQLKVKDLSRWMDENSNAKIHRNCIFDKLVCSHMGTYSGRIDIKGNQVSFITAHFEDKLDLLIDHLITGKPLNDYPRIMALPNRKHIEVVLQIISKVLEKTYSDRTNFSGLAIELPETEDYTVSLNSLLGDFAKKPSVSRIADLLLLEIADQSKLNVSPFMERVLEEIKELDSLGGQESIVYVYFILHLGKTCKVLRQEELEMVMALIVKWMPTVRTEEIMIIMEPLFEITKSFMIQPMIKMTELSMVRLKEEPNNRQLKYRCFKFAAKLRVDQDFFYDDIIRNLPDYVWMIQQSYNKKIILKQFKIRNQLPPPEILRAARENTVSRITAYIKDKKYNHPKELRDVIRQINSIAKNVQIFNYEFIRDNKELFLELSQIFVNIPFLGGISFIYKILGFNKQLHQAIALMRLLSQKASRAQADIWISLHYMSSYWNISLLLKYEVYQLDFDTFYSRDQDLHAEVYFYHELITLLSRADPSKRKQTQVMFRRLQKPLIRYMTLAHYNAHLLVRLSKLFTNYAPDCEQFPAILEQSFLSLVLNKKSIKLTDIRQLMRLMSKWTHRNQSFLKLLSLIELNYQRSKSIVQQYIINHLKRDLKGYNLRFVTNHSSKNSFLFNQI